MDNKYSLFPHYEESVNLRTNGEFDYVYSGSNLSIGKTHLFPENRTQDYSQLNKGIEQQGEKSTEEMKGLMGKAQYIDKPPAWSRQSVRSNIFTFLNNFGIDPENSEFVSHLLAGDPSTELGLADLFGGMAGPEMVEGSRQFRAGLNEGDMGTMGMGALRTTFGATSLATAKASVVFIN